jgi:hypothetical protein
MDKVQQAVFEVVERPDAENSEQRTPHRLETFATNKYNIKRRQWPTCHMELRSLAVGAAM